MKKEYKIGLVIVGLVALYLGYLGIRVGPVELGQASSGLPGAFATSSSNAVPAYADSLSWSVPFATSTSCASRVISTRGVGISLTLGEAGTTTIPTSIFGHAQAASTTVNYDSGVYGCGRWKATSVGAATVITVTEFQ